MTCTIAVANQKGGVAKTTTVVSLAGALAASGKEVLAVDLDAQAGLTLALGIEPQHVRHSVADVLFHWSPLPGITRSTRIPGLDLLPSNSEMNLAERFLPIRKNYEQILRQALASSTSYDYVLLDCPPALGAITVNALNAADLLILPTLPEYFSAYALRSMLASIRRVRSQSNPRLRYRILITLQDRRNRIHRTIAEQLHRAFGQDVFQTTIDVDTKLRESSVAGLPITQFAPTTRAAQQYQALCAEVTQYVKEAVKQPA